MLEHILFLCWLFWLEFIYAQKLSWKKKALEKKIKKRRSSFPRIWPEGMVSLLFPSTIFPSIRPSSRPSWAGQPRPSFHLRASGPEQLLSSYLLSCDRDPLLADTDSSGPCGSVTSPLPFFLPKSAPCRTRWILVLQELIHITPTEPI